MNKQERASLLRKLKPQTWYTFCQFEALNPEEVLITKNDLMLQLEIGSIQTLNKYLSTWESYGLVRQIPGGFIITQLDGTPSNINENPVEREFKNARDIINYWCDLYKQQYEQPYNITNWVMTQTQVKKLLRYPDAEIKATLQAVISLYERHWAKPAYPRPTLGAVCSWLYQQAQPYAVVTTDSPAIEMPESSTDLLNDLEAKGWL